MLETRALVVMWHGPSVASWCGKTEIQQKFIKIIFTTPFHTAQPSVGEHASKAQKENQKPNNPDLQINRANFAKQCNVAAGRNENGKIFATLISTLHHNRRLRTLLSVYSDCDTSYCCCWFCYTASTGRPAKLPTGNSHSFACYLLLRNCLKCMNVHMCV